MKFSAPETLPSGGGNWIDKPGTYHLVVTVTEEQPVSRTKGMIDGFKVAFQAVEGTVRDRDGRFTEKDKTIDLIFWNPKLTDKNEGLFARQKQAAFFVAAGLMREDQLGTEVDITLGDACGHHVIATMEEDEKDGKKRIQLAYADIFHIDDPRAAGFPRNEKALALVPATHRRDPASFNVVATAKPNGATSNGTSSPKTSEKITDDESIF